MCNIRAPVYVWKAPTLALDHATAISGKLIASIVR